MRLQAITLLALVFAGGSARADDADRDEVGPPPHRPMARPPRGGPPGRGLSAEQLRALRAYRDQRLVVRRETEVSGGGVHVHQWDTFGPWPYGWHSSETVVNPVVTTRTWAIYRGPERLSVPTFLETVGATERHAELVGRIHKARRAAHAWLGVSGVGAAGLVAGLVGMAVADDQQTYDLLSLTTLAGGGLTFGGLLGASFPFSRAARLERYPAASLTIGEAQKLVDAYNDRLREQLGITPEQAWRIESGR